MSSFSTHNQQQRQNSRAATTATSHGLVASATLLGDDAPLPSKWVPKQQQPQQQQPQQRSPQSGSIAAPPPSTIRVGANGTPQPLVVMPHGTPQQQPQHPFYHSMPQYHHPHYPAAPAQQGQQQQLPAAPQQVAMTEEASGLPVTSDVAVGMLRELSHDALLQLAEKMMRNFGDNSDPVRRTIRYCHEVKSTTATGVEEQKQQQSHLSHQPQQQQQQQQKGCFTPVLSPQNASGGSLSSSHSSASSASNFGDTTNSVTPPLKHAEGEELFDLEKLMQQARRMYPTEFE